MPVVRPVASSVGPAIFEAATGDLRMGRSRRTATDLQRAALALRDKGCVGCGIAPERCQHHHIDHWQHDGHTDKIHQQGFTVQWDPATSRYGRQPPAQPPNSSHGPSPTDDPSRAPPT
ncbi:MAG: HNH endonuclease [Acidimicrobiaceae bacterium]|nr:HNH endonuclease [Acidimicrobiaceae bacterium]